MSAVGQDAEAADGPYRVMVVDDSAVIRGLLSRTLESDSSVSVVTSVSNGQMALDMLPRYDIEVIVLDIEMPVMDGLTALPQLLKIKPDVQVVMASTLTRKNADISLRAMQAGAADYVAKPSSSGEIHSADDFKRELTEKVKALGAGVRAAKKAKVARTASATSIQKQVPAASTSRQLGQLRPTPTQAPDIIAIGSSTGGPPALFELLRNIGSGITQPIVITQHMPPTFTTLLAEHISRASGIPAAEGKDGEVILGGHIYVAPGGKHMLIEKVGANATIRLTDDPPENYCKPAVDPMLRSMSKVYGSRILVVILTGMGSDGEKGSQVVTAAGGSVIAQDEETSVVWGMPGAVASAGLCSAVLPLPEIAPYIRKLAMRPAA